MKQALTRIACVLGLLCSLAYAQSTNSGAITSTQCVTIDIAQNQRATIGIQVTGTWTYTSAGLQPKISIQGQTPVNVQVTPSTSSTPQDAITANGVYQARVAGGTTFHLCGATVASGTANVYLNASSGVSILSGGGGGSGTVTSFSAGNLSPLFSTSVATATSTPALSFSLSNSAGGTILGNTSTSSGAPAYTATPVLGTTGTTGTLGLRGTTSGTATITPQATAGTPTLTLPNASGTFAVSASLPLSLSSTTGALTCPTCAIGPGTSTTNHLAKFSGTDGVTLADGGVIPAGTVTSAGETVNGSSSSGIFTVSGSPVTTSGTIDLATAGTSGGVPYFSSGTVVSSSAALTSNSPVLGGGAGAAPKTATFLTTDGAAALTIGVAGGGNGVLKLAGNTSGTATFTAPATAGTSTNAVVASNVLQLPNGGASAAALAFAGAVNTGLYSTGSTNMLFTSGGSAYLAFTNVGLNSKSTAFYGISSGDPAATGADTNWSRMGAGILQVGTTAANKSGLIQSGMSVFVTSNFTTSGVGTALENITGLSWTFPATAANWPFHCHIAYSQATGNAAVAFGIKAGTNNPSNIFAQGTIQTNTTAFSAGVLATLSSQTATNIVSATPGATATNFTADLHGMLELPASAVTINLMTSTATAADTVTVLRGSYCSLNP